MAGAAYGLPRLSRDTPTDKLQCGDYRKAWRGCRCDDCRAAAVQYRKTMQYLADTGVATTYPIAPVQQHIERLQAGGMSDRQVAFNAALDRSTVSKIRVASSTARVHRQTAAAILAIPVGTPPDDDDLVPACGANRRLQALRLRGWSKDVICAETQMSRPALDDKLARPRKRLRMHMDRAVRDAYERLSVRNAIDECGLNVASRARIAAVAHGWLPLWVWCDPDDPGSGTSVIDRAPRMLYVVDTTCWMAAVGASRREIEAMCGTDWRSVHRFFQRAGVDIPEVRGA